LGSDRSFLPAAERFGSARQLGSAGATAAAGVAEANVAAATALAAAFQAVAAGLKHLAALGVATGASDAATVLRVFTLAVPAAEVEIADLNSIPGAAARAGSIAERLTKALEGGAGYGIVAAALDAKTTLAFLKLQLAPRHHAYIRRRGRGGGIRRKGRRRSGREGPSTFSQNRAGHKQHSFGERIGPAPANATGRAHPVSS